MSEYKVLIVDDDGPILKALALRFQHSGFEVFCAKDAMSALNVISSERPDVAVLDVNLSGVDGFGLYEKIRQEAGQSIPVLFMSASKSEGVLSHDLLKQGLPFFEKPLDSKDMVREIKHMLQSVAEVTAEIPAVG